MSLDYSLLNIAGRVPFTGGIGDDVEFYSQTRKSKGLFIKTGCDFTTSQSKFGTSSLEFSSQSSKLATKTGFSIGETNPSNPSAYNYTISCWVRPSRVDLQWQGVFAESTSHAVFVRNNTFVYYGSSATLITSPVITANQWYHVALCKSGATATLYVNGVAAGAPINRNVMMSIYYLGSTSAAAEGLVGFMNDFKYENSALYSGNFTPPSAPMSLDLFDTIVNPIKGMNKIPSYIAPSRVNKKLNTSVIIQKTYHMGPGRILGTVKESHLPSDIPLSRRVRLHRKSDGLLIDETWSNAAGNYAFTNIAVQKYYVVAFDHTDTYNAVIKDSVTPEI